MYLLARNSPKQISGASRGFLPRPLSARAKSKIPAEFRIQKGFPLTVKHRVFDSDVWIQEKWPEDYIQENTLAVTLEDIEKFPKLLRTEFEKFLETGDLPKFEIEGWSFKRLAQERSLHPIGVFIMFGWLQREPEKAKAALNQGFDAIISNIIHIK